ncbi:MAG: hypothetical protein KKH72_13100 [Alphaproteobacteria bacterium]|nr:hypothetical protein [Alphaproteobacteria bacterium]
MTRFVLWTLGGVFLGLIIHLIVILNLPRLANNDLWNRMAAIAEPGEIALLDAPAIGEGNPLELDPALAVAVCRLDLDDGPGIVSGRLPDDFWSVSVFNTDGIAFFSTTHRAATANRLNLGIFNPAQTRLLAERDIAEQSDFLLVESPGNQVFATVRLAPPHRAMLESYRKRLAELDCSNLPALPVVANEPPPAEGGAPVPAPPRQPQ